jgi:hypothetical protein
MRKCKHRSSPLRGHPTAFPTKKLFRNFVANKTTTKKEIIKGWLQKATAVKGQKMGQKNVSLSDSFSVLPKIIA